jgi:ectoine hydroxylase-related dioxygenase (phytanoyl-CoA dioxygenase family)
MNQGVFFSEDLQRRFHRDGIVKIPMLDKEDIEQLRSFYDSGSSGLSDRKFHSTMFINNAEYRKKANDQIQQIILNKVNTMINNYKMPFANFIVKEVDADTRVGIHQDWNFTSPEYTSINVWIPLVDINEQTGLFYGLKGSHRTFRNLRYTPYEDNRYEGLEPFILKNSEAFSVKAGEALIYDGALIHFSDPNMSAFMRIAIGAVMIPAEAPNLHYYKRDSNKKTVEVYKVNDAFYQSFDFFEEPKGVEKISEIDHYNVVPDAEEIEANASVFNYPVFKDRVNEDAITEKGYVVLRGLIPGSVCDELSAFYKQHEMIDTRQFTISNWNNDLQHRDETFQKISGLIEPYSKNVLFNHKPIIGVFTSKRPGAGSDMLLHQDWSLVDEAKYRSVSVWVALCDMNHSNGNLQVAEYSHIYASQPRGMNMTIPFEDLRKEIETNYLTDLPLKKGDAIIFDHRLVHASPPNQTDRIRLAAVLALIPSEAPLIHYYKDLNTENEVEILSLNNEDFRQIDFFDMPNRPKHSAVLGKSPMVFRQITLNDIKKRLSRS